MAAQTGSTYFSGTTIDSVEIPELPLPIQYFISARHGQKTQNCLWNFDAIYHSSRDMSISGLGGHIDISGCRSLSQSFGNTFFELVMVENPEIAVGISTLSVIVSEI